jgi:Uma2 family endonuclease
MHMATVPPKRATVDDLYRVEGKAELIGGKIVTMPFLGCKPALTVGAIVHSLYDYEKRIGKGEVYMSTLAYIIPQLPSGRESFCPDASYYVGPLPSNPWSFIYGPPTLAVEVRDEFEFGPPAEQTMAEKRADYFAAGTLVVWDVDPVHDRIHGYRANDPGRPTTYECGQIAEAEPALPGWRVDVSAIFDRTP